MSPHVISLFLSRVTVSFSCPTHPVFSLSWITTLLRSMVVKFFFKSLALFYPGHCFLAMSLLSHFIEIQWLPVLLRMFFYTHNPNTKPITNAHLSLLQHPPAQLPLLSCRGRFPGMLPCAFVGPSLCAFQFPSERPSGASPFPWLSSSNTTSSSFIYVAANCMVFFFLRAAVFPWCTTTSCFISLESGIWVVTVSWLKSSMQW